MTRYGYANNSLAQGYATVIGVVLVLSGLLGFINNPFVGTGPQNDGTGVILAANSVHNLVHLGTGALALFIAFGLRGEAQANGVIAFGVVYLLIGILVLVDPLLFGLFNPIRANVGDHVLHFALVIVSFIVGYMARGSSSTAATHG